MQCHHLGFLFRERIEQFVAKKRENYRKPFYLTNFSMLQYHETIPIHIAENINAFLRKKKKETHENQCIQRSESQLCFAGTRWGAYDVQIVERVSKRARKEQKRRAIEKICDTIIKRNRDSESLIPYRALGNAERVRSRKLK